MKGISRRTFLGRGSTLAAAAPLLGAGARVARANDRIGVGVIGLGARGQTHVAALERLADVRVVALCDVDDRLLAARAGAFETAYGRQVRRLTDLRRLLDDPGIDAVSIATPDHWHALAAIWACQAGKDAYVESPGAHDLIEGRRLVDAARRHRRIVQHGIQLRSAPAIRQAVSLLRRGAIGDLREARGICHRWRGAAGRGRIKRVPDHIRYDLWLGPARARPYAPALLRGGWRRHWDFGSGELGGDGVRHADLCIWGLGLDALPSRVSATGGRFLWDDGGETPEFLSCLYTYPDRDVTIRLELRPWSADRADGTGAGITFYGTDGRLVIEGPTRYALYHGRTREPGPRAEFDEADHFANFIAAVRARDARLLHAPPETARLASALACLGATSYRVGHPLEFDPRAERFPHDAEADALLTRAGRPPFALPARA